MFAVPAQPRRVQDADDLAERPNPTAAAKAPALPGPHRRGDVHLTPKVTCLSPVCRPFWLSGRSRPKRPIELAASPATSSYCWFNRRWLSERNPGLKPANERLGRTGALEITQYRERQQINLPRVGSRSVAESGGWHGRTPKRRSGVSVPFPASLADELAAPDGRQGPRRAGVHRSARRGAAPVEPLHGCSRPAVQKCQADDDTFPTITPHDLRHTAASLAVSAGANVEAVQRMLGHAKASMTLDVSADLFDEVLTALTTRLRRRR